MLTFSHYPSQSQQEWDKFYLGLAKYVSEKSKDPSTKYGCAIVRPDHSLASIGYNGFPMRMSDDNMATMPREEKYSRVIHGEMNALGFCQDSSLHGYTSYGYPFMTCDRCFVVMVQKGVARFVSPKCPADKAERWEPSFARVRGYAKECGVTIDEIDFE